MFRNPDQTFAVLLAGGVLGANRGALSMGLYVALGAIGLPFYADGDGGCVAPGRTPRLILPCSSIRCEPRIPGRKPD
jgi:hypothetical protein